MNSSNKYIKEVEQALARHANNKNKADQIASQRYLGTSLAVWGIASPLQKQLCKSGYSFYSDNKTATFQIYTEIYKGSTVHEVRSQALIYLEQNYRHIPPALQAEHLPDWMEVCENWAHSDYLSKFYTRLLEHPTTKAAMLRQLERWNQDDNLWKRRQSLVSLLYYARTKTDFLPFRQLIGFAKPLLHDEAYYVQKGLGWFLREAYNVYPEATFRFIEQHVSDIRPAAFTTCLEKMSAAEKETLKRQRKRS